jgi:ribosome-associated translation inhibitor RaiA
MNIFAAADIVEAKLKNHLRKYKEKHSTRPRLFKLRRRAKR